MNNVVFLLFIIVFSPFVAANGLIVSKSITLEAGKLALSLTKVSALYNTSFVADSKNINVISHKRIAGHYNLKQLLTVLLKNTNIKFQFVGEGVVLTAADIPLLRIKNEKEVTSSEIESILVVGSRKPSQILEPAQASRSNLSEALAAQYRNDHLGEYISYAGLSTLPNQNVAEAIGYFPGISVGRSFGEGLTVNSRGLGPLYQSISLNGHLLAVNENVRNSGQSGRAFRFDVLPIQNVSQINVIKSPTADLADSAIGSSIAIEMFKPLTLNKPLFIGTVNFEYNDKSEQFSPQLSWLKSWVNDEKNIGIVFTGGISERYIRQESFQTWDWELNDNSYFLDTVEKNTLIPSNRIALTLEQEKRENTSLGFALEWEVDDNLSLSMNYFYSELALDFNEQRILARLDSANEPPQNIQLVNNTLIGASFNEVLFKTALETSSQQHNNYIGMVDLNWQPGQWNVDLSIAYSEAKSMTEDPIRRTRFSVKPQPFSFLFPLNFKTKPVFNLQTYPSKKIDFDTIDHVSARAINVIDHGISANISGSHSISLGIFNDITLGGNFRRQTRDYFRQDRALSQDTYNSIDINQADLFAPTQLTLLNVMPNYPPLRWLSPTLNVQNKLEHLFTFAEFTDADLANSYGLIESSEALFVRLNYDIDVNFPITGNIGLRWRHWQADINGGISENVFLNQKTQLLANFSANAKLSSQWQIKLSVANTASLPSYTDFNPSITLNSTDGVFLARGGNPLLTPIEAIQWDAGLFWYFSDEANISLGYFKKDIENFIVNQARLAEFNGQMYRFTQPTNNGKAHINGWEFGYQQNFYNGFGVQYNLTLIDSYVLFPSSKVLISDELEGVSPLSYNLQFFYEAAPWIYRLGFDYRSDYLETLSVTDVPSTRLNAQQTLKFYVGYQITEQVILSLSGRNLWANPEQYYFQTGEHNVIKSVVETEKSFSIGLSVHF